MNVSINGDIADEPDWPGLVREFRTAATAYWTWHPTNQQKKRFHAAYGELFSKKLPKGE